MKINYIENTIRPMIEIEFNNSKYPALVDSGSEVNAMFLTQNELHSLIKTNILENVEESAVVEGGLADKQSSSLMICILKQLKIGNIQLKNVYIQVSIVDETYDFSHGKFIIGYPILKNYNYKIYNDKRVVEFILIDDPYNTYNFRDFKTLKLYKTLTEIIEQSDDNLLIRNLNTGCNIRIQKELIQVLDNFIIMHHMENEPDKYLKVYNKLMHIEE